MVPFLRRNADADAWTVDEAMCAFASHMVYVDGMVAREEQDALVDLLRQVHPSDDGRHTGRAVRKALDRVNKRVRNDGEEAVLRAAADALPTNQRPVAYAVTAALAHSDEDLGDDEHAYLEHVRSLLALTKAQASKAVKSLAAREG